MKVSRKVFAVLSIALPLMLVVSMVHAESNSSGGGSGSSSECKMSNSDTYRMAKWECHDGTIFSTGNSTAECKSPDALHNKAESFCKGRCNRETGKCGINSYAVDLQCGEKVCERLTDCPDVSETIRKCELNGWQVHTYQGKGGCTQVDCRKPWETPTSSVADDTVMCKRNLKGNFWVFSCEDGKTMRVPANEGQDKPKPPTLSNRCGEMEQQVKYIKEKLSKFPESPELKRELEQAMKKWEMCRGSSAMDVAPARTRNAGCKITVDEKGCKITRCGIRVMRSCPTGGSSSSAS